MPNSDQHPHNPDQENLSLKDQVIKSLLEKLSEYHEFDEAILTKLRLLNDEGNFSDKDQIKESISS